MYTEERIQGIEDFSYWSSFYFHKVTDEQIQYVARHPRNNHDYPKVGILHSAGKIVRIA